MKEGLARTAAAAPPTLITPSHLVVVYELVHAPRAQGGAHGVCQGHAGVDVADQLRRALAGVCPLLEQDDLGLLFCDTAAGDESSTKDKPAQRRGACD